MAITRKVILIALTFVLTWFILSEILKESINLYFWFKKYGAGDDSAAFFSYLVFLGSIIAAGLIAYLTFQPRQTNS